MVWILVVDEDRRVDDFLNSKNRYLHCHESTLEVEGVLVGILLDSTVHFLPTMRLTIIGIA